MKAWENSQETREGLEEYRGVMERDCEEKRFHNGEAWQGSMNCITGSDPSSGLGAAADKGLQYKCSLSRDLGQKAKGLLCLGAG